MAKKKTQFVCQNCGHGSAQWMGRCPGCGEWNSMVEEMLVEPADRPIAATSARVQAAPLTEVSGGETTRFDTGIAEMNRVLGGGLVPGALVLLAGDPGIGKSTLTMQMMASAQVERPVLYISGEESRGQIKNRAERLGVDGADIVLATENDMELLQKVVEETKPGLIVLDSIQTVFDPALSAAPGSVSQLRQIAMRCMQWSKGRGIPTVLVGHVTKVGAVAGPRVLEHMVDAVLFFEGDRNSQYRILRTFKNRFGSTNEIGLFDMQSTGLMEVPNPSVAFLAERPSATPGSAVTATLEGSRPILVEIQALVAPTVFGQPRRMSTGADHNRLAMLLAVVEKRLGVAVANHDVYLNVVGGLRIDEPAADLAMAMAVVSAALDRPLPDDLLLIGELGLTGELRQVSQVERRLHEGAGLGFKRALVSAGHRDVRFEAMRVETATTLQAAMQMIWEGIK